MERNLYLLEFYIDYGFLYNEQTIAKLDKEKAQTKNGYAIGSTS